MLVTWQGPSPLQSVPDAGIVAERDVPVDVPDEIGRRLLDQATWSAGRREHSGERGPVPLPKTTKRRARRRKD